MAALGAFPGQPMAAASQTASSSNGSWISQLSSSERSTLVATFGGWALDGMDVMVYSFVIPSLIAAWHISQKQAGLLGTAALLLSAIGGWLAGTLADRFGRARVLQITILWFAFFTFLCGFTQTFTQLLVARGLQGLGFGGEWAVGSVLMGEAIRAQHRGKAVGVVQGGWAVGWALAAIFYSILFKALPEPIAWRALFWIGILPALLVFYIRRRVPEPPVYAETRKRLETSGAGVSLLQVFSPEILRVTLLTSVLALGAQGGYYAITTWLPTFLKTERKLSVLNTTAYVFVVILGSFTGYMVSAYLTDRLGRKKTLILFAISSFVAVIAYTFLPLSNPAMLVLGFPLGFFSSGVFSPIGPFFTELFPSRLRATGQGFSYNFGRGVGALFPTLVGYISGRLPLGQAIAIFSASAYLIMILGTVLLPETRGKELRAYE
ncbi:MAG TPA: MFS transporter [Candidatus Acidoferrales bacterium]|nr:MFS transporter [Candidatus Acidoferrales bacterium]